MGRSSHITVALASLSLLVGACAGPDDEATADIAQAATVRPPDPARELVITDLSVVEAQPQTIFDPTKTGDDPHGAWTFGRLIDNLQPFDHPTAMQRTQFVLAWLKLWERDQLVNFFVVPARPAIRTLVIDPWRADSGCAPDSAPIGQFDPFDTCTLDFTKAPFRLLAIANRPDLRVVSSLKGTFMDGGQGRFVFGVLSKNDDGTERKLAFTVIFEYQLPAKKTKDITDWASRWHALGDKNFGQQYNDALLDVTKRFTKRGAGGSWTANGSALLQLRTNEISLSDETPKRWQLREFVLTPFGLAPTTIKDEPDESWNGTPELGAFVAQNANGFLGTGVHLPTAINLFFPFLAGQTQPRAEFVWQVPGVAEDVRHAFALATCSGCHLSETGGVAGTNFLHVKTRVAGVASTLSPFLASELAGPRSADFSVLLASPDPKNGPGKDHHGVDL